MKEGMQAPDVPLRVHTGETFRLSAFQGKPVVLFFYPKDESPICTREVCAFRDAYEDFVDAGAVVIGVSGDPVEAHQAFAQRYRLPFWLVSDEKGTLRKAFQVPKTMGFFPGRVTYVVDPEGVIRMIFESQFSAQEHVDRALEVIRSFKQT